MKGSFQHERGRALAAQGRLLEAMMWYEAALASEPERIDVHRHLGDSFAEAHTNLGAAFWMLGDSERALRHLHRASSIDPGYAPAYGHLGNALAEMGRLDEARAAFDRALDCSQRSGWLYRRWAEVRTVRTDEPHFEALRRLARDPSSLSEEERMHLHFGAAKAFTDTGDDEAAARHLIAGNRQKRASIDYDEAASLAVFERIRATCTRELFRDRHVEPPGLPVFVVGMPRSGTTLVEQLLASHPQVHGAGELTTFERVFNTVRAESAMAAEFPEALAAFSPDSLRRLGEEYVARVRKLAPEAARIVDKMPANVLFLGAIVLAMPGARILHVRRDPLDTCLSCYANLFTGNQPFAYDLGELGRYYRAYDRLTQHWREVLPPGRVLEVRYEELVGDFERRARAIVAHCGLEWSDACLRFYDDARIVRTASAAQVRRPPHDGSIGRHRRFETMLQPLRDALGP